MNGTPLKLLVHFSSAVLCTALRSHDGIYLLWCSQTTNSPLFSMMKSFSEEPSFSSVRNDLTECLYRMSSNHLQIKLSLLEDFIKKIAVYIFSDACSHQFYITYISYICEYKTSRWQAGICDLHWKNVKE